MFLNPPSLPELRMWAQVKCSHRKPSSASIGRLHDLQISFKDHESGRRYRCLPFPLFSYLLYGQPLQLYVSNIFRNQSWAFKLKDDYGSVTFTQTTKREILTKVISQPPYSSPILSTKIHPTSLQDLNKKSNINKIIISRYLHEKSRNLPI